MEALVVVAEELAGAHLHQRRVVQVFLVKATLVEHLHLTALLETVVVVVELVVLEQLLQEVEVQEVEPLVLVVQEQMPIPLG
jgi:hypothetical protein